MVARRESTRRWWAEESPNYDLVASAFVVGEFPGKSEAIALIQHLPLLEVVPEVEDIVQAYVGRKLMPQKDLGDAYHLAVASYYGVHFLLTWNCRHRANANKVPHLQVVNSELGLSVPVVTTPDLLLQEADDEPG